MASDNQVFMKQFTEFINTANAKMAGEIVAPDAVFHVPGRAYRNF